MKKKAKKKPVVGKAAGGVARAESLTAEQRKEIAQKAAKKRWEEKKDMPRAAFVGTLTIGDLSFPCSVLSDGTRVLTQSDFMSGMGMYYSGWVAKNNQKPGSGGTPHFLAFKSLELHLDRHLGDLQSIVLQYVTDKGKVAHGIKAEIIPKICEVWLDAEEAGGLGSRQLQIAQKAKIMMRALAHVGIIALVDEATGYQGVRPQDALQAYLDKVLRTELAAWAKKFPDEFYENIYKLRGWPWPGMRKNRFSVVAHYTRDLIYERIGPGVLKELESKEPKDDKGNRRNRLHQWLSDDFGSPMLAQHLHSVITLQRLAIANAHGWKRFVNMVDQVMPKRGDTLQLPFGDPTDPNGP